MIPGQDATAAVRKAAYAILIALAAGNMLGRLIAVNSVSRIDAEKQAIGRRIESLKKQLSTQGHSAKAVATKLAKALPTIEAEERRQTPFLSANDRSRWLAMRALVEQGTFAIDGVVDLRTWNTIDMVQHRGRNGKLHLYSSKPPLLSTLLAGLYWLVKAATGWTLADHPYAVGRLMLAVVNVIPMIALLALVACWAERLGSGDFGRLFVVAAAAFGTLLSPFAVVLSNHLIGACAAAATLEAVLRITVNGDARLRWYALAGAAAAFTAADELPALSLLAAVGLGLWRYDRRAWLRGFLPAALAIVVAFFATNYAAHDSLRPPYAHRSETDPVDNWYKYTYTIDGETRQSYWLAPQGIDRGEPSKSRYAFHMLLGHHGVFSLTPMWLLSVWGAWLWFRSGDRARREIALGTAGISLACIVFYALLRPQADRNYGGMTCGFRWLLWLAPLWLALMLPAAERIARSHAGRCMALILLAASVLSASFPTWNPWIHPWLWNVWEAG